ncbi:Protein of unknown function [Bacillus thuringiensis]|uniref:Uncharacterized protein n=1 Tax=Bacillus thuringiensis TaxID=1428 RepID=A0A1C4C3L6_BACTU|nr:Protein of unknown function [Bacillus thuringiensis]
MKKALIFLS